MTQHFATWQTYAQHGSDTQAGDAVDARQLQQAAEARQAFLLSTLGWCEVSKQPVPFLETLQSAVDALSPQQCRMPGSIVQTLRKPGTAQNGR